MADTDTKVLTPADKARQAFERDRAYLGYVLDSNMPELQGTLQARRKLASAAFQASATASPDAVAPKRNGKGKGKSAPTEGAGSEAPAVHA